MADPLVRRRDFVIGMGAISGLAASTSKLSADERVFGVRRSRGDVRLNATCDLAFPAIAAASMPEVLVIGDGAPGVRMRGRADLGESLAGAGYVELRRYRFDRDEDRVRAREVFVRAGIQPLLTGESGDFLFGFKTLGSREKAWREIIVEPQWVGLRAQLQDVAIYKTRSDAVCA